jgi:hypothetical protein
MSPTIRHRGHLSGNRRRPWPRGFAAEEVWSSAAGGAAGGGRRAAREAVRPPAAQRAPFGSDRPARSAARTAAAGSRAAGTPTAAPCAAWPPVALAAAGQCPSTAPDRWATTKRSGGVGAGVAEAASVLMPLVNTRITTKFRGTRHTFCPYDAGAAGRQYRCCCWRMACRQNRSFSRSRSGPLRLMAFPGGLLFRWYPLRIP